MKGRTVILFLSFCMVLLACKKEIGKRDYEMNFKFDSGDEINLTGRIFEKYKKNKKYLAQIDGGYSLKMIDGIGLYMDFSYDNTTVAIKTSDKEIICNDYWEFWLQNQTMKFANNQSGKFIGDMYLEGGYTQKGRAYSVENGDFKFYWRNAADFGMSDTILRGKWTLKRK